MKRFTLLLLLAASFTVSAQKEANNWYFGNFGGIHFLDDGSVEALTDGAMTTNEGCSSISDSNGNLLMYTDGRNVWDRNHVIMPNGNYALGTGLLGDPSSTQSAIIVPNEENPDIYYIFTVDEPHHVNASVYPEQYSGEYVETNGTSVSTPEADDGFNNGLNYSIVDLSIVGDNGSIGDVTLHNVHLVTYDPADIDQAKYKCSEKITAVKNDDGTGYWVITHFIDKFYAFPVGPDGPIDPPVVSTVNPVVPTSGYRRNAIGCIKVSPDGSKIAIAHVQIDTTEGSAANNGASYVYDFDNNTGLLSNPIQLKNNAGAYGVEFSPKSEKLYVSYDNAGSFGGVYQYDLLADDIPDSEIKVANTTQSGTLQLGPNGKIYRAIVQSEFLDVIHNPDEPGTLCNYQLSGVALDGGVSMFGLPPFITSFFMASIIYDGTCLGDATQFELNVTDDYDSVEWDFGDGSPSSSEDMPLHTYAAAGTYNVTADITRDGEVSSVSIDVAIHAVPVANMPQNLQECDPENDGTANFTLSENTAAILNGQSDEDFSVTYHISQEDADNGATPLNDTSYTNTSDPQHIYARVANSNNPACYTTTQFEIRTLPSPQLAEQDERVVCLNTDEYIRLDALSDTASTAGLTFEWSTGSDMPYIEVNQPGIYSVTVTNALGCENTLHLTVIPSDVAVIDDIIIEDLRDINTVLVLASPPAGVETTYRYSLDKPNGPFRESNFFEDVEPGIHTVYIKDDNGCGVISKQISVLSIPKYFTPNGDGVNDTWNIVGMNTRFYAQSEIFIFDRYGKLLGSADPRGPGWDGTYEGAKLPSTDYWYVVRLDDGRTVKGHFSIVR